MELRETSVAESLLGQAAVGLWEWRGTAGQKLGAQALEPECLGLVLLHHSLVMRSCPTYLL